MKSAKRATWKRDAKQASRSSIGRPAGWGEIIGRRLPAWKKGLSEMFTINRLRLPPQLRRWWERLNVGGHWLRSDEMLEGHALREIPGTPRTRSLQSTSAIAGSDDVA